MSANVDPYIRVLFNANPNGTLSVQLKIPSDVIPDLTRIPGLKVLSSKSGMYIVSVTSKRSLDILEQTPGILSIERAP